MRCSSFSSELEALSASSIRNATQDAERLEHETRAQEQEVRDEIALVQDQLRKALAGESPAGGEGGESPGDPDPAWRKIHGGDSLLDIRGGATVNSPDGLALCGEGAAMTMSGGQARINASKIVLVAGTIEQELEFYEQQKKQGDHVHHPELEKYGAAEDRDAWLWDQYKNQPGFTR